jgi:hypothetical protein
VCIETFVEYRIGAALFGQPKIKVMRMMHLIFFAVTTGEFPSVFTVLKCENKKK